MRILFLTQTFPRDSTDTSGPFIRDIARGLVRLGDEVVVLTPHAEGLAPRWEVDGVEVVTFRYAPERWELLGYGRSLEADETIRRGALLAAPGYALAARQAVGKATRRGRFDLVHAHWVVPNGVAVGTFGRQSTPLAIGLHGSDVFLAERRLFRPLVRRALARACLLTGCSPELVDRVRALGFPAARSHVIPYGVDGDLFRPSDVGAAGAWRRRLGIPPDGVVALGVGRMATKKGFHHLVSIAPSLLERRPALHLVLAGAGDLLPELRRRAADHPRIHFPGAVLRDTLPDLYRSADLFVLPAVHDRRGNVDGLPNVILEAMASGLPVVASGISGIPLAVRDGENGRLVPEGDEPALLEAMVALSGDPEQRRSMGAAARRRATTELSWDAVALRYRAAYLSALGGELGGASVRNGS